jgi:site-specific DNA-methyltransferase (adenine-specific)
MEEIDLRLGDCLEVMQTIPDKSIDLVLTDPPYGIGIAKNPFRQKFEKKQWDNFIPTKQYFDEIFRISKNQVIWGGNYFTEHLPPSRCFYIWDKVQPEKFSSAMVEMAWVSKQSPAKMFRQRVTAFKKHHPTTKPINLMEWCLSFFPDSKTVLDPFMGSGSTGVACKHLGIKFIGIEKDQEYYEIAKNRLLNE